MNQDLRSGRSHGENHLLDAVKSLAPAFKARAHTHDSKRTYPLENMRELGALGIAGMGLPKSFGGMGMSLEAQLEITEEIAMACGSTALALSMHRVSADILLTLRDFAYGQQILRDVCADGSMLCSVVSIPTTEVDSRKAGLVAVDTGASYTISGRSGFATNSDGSRYLMLFCGLKDVPGVLIVPVRMDAPGVTNLKNWNGMGMRGSASHDIVIEGAVVPKSEAYLVPVEQLAALSDDNPEKPSTFAILGVWLGLAQAAFDFTLSYVGKRYGFMAGTGFNAKSASFDEMRSEQAWAQIAVGEMDCEIWRARGAIQSFATRYDRGAFPDMACLKAERIRIYHITRDLIEKVMMAATKVCGAHAYVESQPLGRIIRDALAGIVMKQKNDQLAQELGALLFANARQKAV